MSRGDQDMITIREAVRRTGRSRATINRAIRSGLLSAHREATGTAWMIDPAELHRIWPEPAQEPAQELDHDQDAIRLRDALIATHEQTIADLRHRLDQADAERRAAQERITALLTDQRPAPPAPARRSRWPWRRE